ELVGELLEEHPARLGVLDHLPESGRAAAEPVVVTVVVRPDAVPGRLEDSTPDDVEAEAEQHVEVGCPDPLQRLLGEPMDEALPDRLHLQALDAGEERRAAHALLGVVDGPPARVQALVEVVGEPRPQPTVAQAPPERAGPRDPRPSLPGTLLQVEDEQ